MARKANLSRCPEGTSALGPKPKDNCDPVIPVIQLRPLARFHSSCDFQQSGMAITRPLCALALAIGLVGQLASATCDLNDWPTWNQVNPADDTTASELAKESLSQYVLGLEQASSDLQCRLDDGAKLEVLSACSEVRILSYTCVTPRKREVNDDLNHFQ